MKEDKIHEKAPESVSVSNANIGFETASSQTSPPPTFQLRSAANVSPESSEGESEASESIESPYQFATAGAPSAPSDPPENGNAGQPFQLALEGKSTSSNNSNAPFQLKAGENKTGMPDQLKSGVENLSGYSMDDVKVHYNSSKPAQLQAHAYAQGTDIHIGPGQEQHLPHEAWHVAQQKQGRVQPTTQMKGANVNDDAGLEKEADVMGAKSMQAGASSAPVQRKTEGAIDSSAPVQMAKPSKAKALSITDASKTKLSKKKGGKLKPGDRHFSKHGGKELKAQLKSEGDQNIPTSFMEYDVNPKQAGQGRDAERIVVGSDGRMWYTGDHYKTFEEIT